MRRAFHGRRYPRCVARGTPLPSGRDPHPARSLTRGSSDILRETCPDDLGAYDYPPPPPPPGPPSAWRLFGPPLGLCACVVLVAALHSLVGKPLGEQWAAEVWEMAKMAIWPTVAATGVGWYIHRNNAAAWRALPRTPTGSYRIVTASQEHGPAASQSMRRLRRADDEDVEDWR